jgi:DNA-binding SARP family transcriptional activator
MVSVRLFDAALPSPSLPFVLGVQAPDAPAEDNSRFDVILERLDSLQALATQSQTDLDLLRRMNSELLEIVRRVQPDDAAPVPATSEAVIADAPAGTSLSLRLLGSFDVQMRGQSIGKWPSRKARLVLAYLAIERGRMVAKDVLIDLFWPDAPPERGSNNLSIAIHQLRTALGAIDPDAAQCIVVRQGLYGVDAAKVSVDLWEFQNSLAEARRALERKDDASVRLSLAAATDICQGDLLESDPYEEWAGGPRRSLGVAFVQSLVWLAEDASKHGDWPRVLEYAARILQRDRCDEAAHRWLMTAHWKLGNRPQALQQYRLYEEALEEELGVQPSDEARLLREQILAQP